MQTSLPLGLIIYISICLVLLMRIRLTYDNHYIIIYAIRDYRLNCVINNLVPEVEYDDMENFIKTLFRFNDCGYTKILSSDKLTIIKPYIKRLKGEDN